MDEPLTSKEKARLFETLDEQSKQLGNLERGLYGDAKNNQRGLVHEVAEIKSWIEKSKRKIAFIAGVGTAIGFLFNKAWEWFSTNK